MGGRRRNKHANKKPRVGRGPVSKTAVVPGAKDRKTNKVRAKVVEATDAKTLQKFVGDNAAVYTDDAAAYKFLACRSTMRASDSVGEYVRDMAHTNGIGACSRAHRSFTTR